VSADQEGDPSDADIGELLTRIRTIAIVGVSARPSRPSRGVAAYLAEHAPEYELWFVNPSETEVLGRPCYASLADLPVVPDLVDVFRRVEHLADVTDEAIAIGAGSLWFQLGLRDEVAAARARGAGLAVVQDRCIEIEHARHRG